MSFLLLVANDVNEEVRVSEVFSAPRSTFPFVDPRQLPKESRGGHSCCGSHRAAV
jgi:hypothetical protein